jgi:hypothetical protein
MRVTPWHRHPSGDAAEVRAVLFAPSGRFVLPTMLPARQIRKRLTGSVFPSADAMKREGRTST